MKYLKNTKGDVNMLINAIEFASWIFPSIAQVKWKKSVKCNGYNYLVKSNEWSTISAAFWLVVQSRKTLHFGF